MTKVKKYRLSIYLIKENYTNFDDILKDRSVLNSYKFKNKRTDEIVLYVKSSKSNVPNWVLLFRDLLENKIENLFNSTSAAVLIVKHNERYFAFTFGYGRNLLNLDCIEESFGLRVALNSIDPDKVRSIDIKNIDTVVRHAKVQTSQAGAMDNFGMNVDRDILNGVTGKTNDEFFGKTISGSTAVYLSFPLTVDNFGKLCARLLEKYNDESYKKNFAWVDHIKEVRDRELADKLNDQVIIAIKERSFEHLFLAAPVVVDWEHFERFEYKGSGDLEEDMLIEKMFPADEQEKVSLNLLKEREILFIGSDNQIIYRWSVYNCINYEFKKGIETFLLTGGKWFKIDTDYVDSVNKELEGVAEYKNFAFPQYSEMREDEYNKKVSENNKEKCFLMDKNNILFGGGQSKIEFCDLIIHKTDFIHIKRFKGGSSTLSHLFFQGAISARLFLSSQPFRKLVNGFLPNDWKFPLSVKALDYEIVFAIISKATEGIKDILPFFSKISFLQTYNQLILFGYKVSIVKIGMKK